MEKSFDFDALLKNNEKKHKRKPVQFMSVAGGVRKRLETTIKNRKSTRLTVFDSIRNLGKCESPKPKPDVQTKVEQRRMQLEKWKQEREKSKKEAAARKKKPFVAGVPHNPLKFVPPPPPPKPLASTSGRVTRSQSAKSKNNVVIKQNSKPVPEKKLPTTSKSFAPKNAKFNPKLNNIVKPPLAHPGKDKTDNVFSFKSFVKNADITNKNEKSKNNAKTATTITKPNKQSKIITPKKPVPKSESNSEEKLRSPRSPVNVPMTPEQIEEAAKKISPRVTLSRGKDNARKEMKKKYDKGLLQDDVCVDSVDHFKRQLDSEIKRMTGMCETWDKINEQIQLPEEVQEAILSAVGQARLLMSQKLQQFAGLLARFGKTDSNEQPVTTADLQGFWDMVFMQVENIDIRFKRLEELRARNWSEEVAPSEPPGRAPGAGGRGPCASGRGAPARGPRAPRAAASRLKDVIAAARKAKREQESQTSTDDTLSVSSLPNSAESKTFEAGFFSVRSPVKSPRSPRSPHPTLLKAVLSSEAKKSVSKISASYAMLRASLISKNMENDDFPLFVQETAPPTPINLHATPGRSILKSANSKSEKKSSKKSIKLVLFDNSKTDEIDQSMEMPNISGMNLKDTEEISGITKLDTITIASGDMEVENDKENKPKRKSKLQRQDALEERSPVMTRSRRKSIQTPIDESKGDFITRRSRRKTMQEVDVNMDENVLTPRSSRRTSKV